jgi:diaminopimelate decarboxylase
MFGFRRNAQGVACLGDASIRDLVASSGLETPLYLYDLDAIRRSAEELDAAFGPAPHLVAYAVKANSAGSILRTVSSAGLGADVVSGGELSLALALGIAPRRILMSGVAKTDREIDRAIAEQIFGIQIESVEEIERVAARARAQGRRARVSIRVNPDVRIDSHAHISTGHEQAKFGVALADVPSAFARIDREPAALAAVGISVHVGSMMSTPEPYRRAARGVAELAVMRRGRSTSLEYVDFGGGIGIDYGQGECEPPAAFARAARDVQAEFGLSDLMLVMEPGRCLVAAHGVLVAKVVGAKVTRTGRFLLLDAGMNDLIRPALYQAHHRVEPIDFPPGDATWRVVGPVCESADDFGTHPLGERIPDLVVLRDAGAYGFSMASEYNGRPLPAELFVSEGRIVSASRSPGETAWVARRVSA